MQQALADSYRSTGMFKNKDADAVANAVLRRAQVKDADVDTSVHGLLQADGQEFLRESLVDSGLPQSEIDGIMKRLVGDAEERGKAGFTKSRNEVDMETEIVNNFDCCHSNSFFLQANSKPSA